MPPFVAIPIIGVALAWLVSVHVLGMGPENSRPLGWDRVVSWGAPMAMIVYAGVLSRDIRSPIVKPAVRLGDASYSLYLVHPFVTLIWAKIAGVTGLAATAPLFVICLGTAASVVAALLLYQVFERPVYQALRGLVEKPDRAPPATFVAAGK